MALNTLSIFLLFLFFLAIAGAEKKKVQKIVIHVPYKIHKHHHTHTKYKLIPVPAPKKEETVIYYKQPIVHQPEVKLNEVPHQTSFQFDTKEIPHHPPIQANFKEVTHHQPLNLNVKEEVQKPFIPPHQLSASSFLEDIHESKITKLPQLEIEDAPHTELKPLDLHFGESGIKHDTYNPGLAVKSVVPLSHENFTPLLSYKPLISQSHVDIVPKYSFKSVVPHENIFPKYSLKHIISQPHENVIPKYSFKQIVPHTIESFVPKYTNKPIISPNLGIKFSHKPIGLSPHIPITPNFSFKSMSSDPYKVSLLQDNVAHSSNLVYKNSVPIKSSENNSYEVKEPNQENLPPPNFSTNLIKNTKEYKYKIVKGIKPGDPEYDHVGYLIIDGASRKAVGKDFKSELHLNT